MESTRRRVKVHSARNTLQAGYSLLHSLAPPSPTLTRFAGLSAGPQCRGCGPGPQGSHPEGKLGDKSTGAGADLWLCLRSPPAAALRWVRLAFCFPCLEARLAGQQSRGAALTPPPLRGPPSHQGVEGQDKAFPLPGGRCPRRGRMRVAFERSTHHRLPSPRKIKEGTIFSLEEGPFKKLLPFRQIRRRSRLIQVPAVGVQHYGEGEIPNL